LNKRFATVLAALAVGLGLAEASNPQFQRELDDLKALSGSAFDIAYLFCSAQPLERRATMRIANSGRPTCLTHQP